MKKKSRGWIWVLVLVLLAAALALLLPRLLPQAGLDANSQLYRAEKVTKGDIQVTVHGTGSLEALQTVDAKADAAGTVKEVLVENGDQVKAGQVIARLDEEAVKQKIDSLEDQIQAQDAAIATMRAMPGVKTLITPVAGRVKAVYAKAGNDVTVPMSRRGALMVLSTDGKMNVRFTPTDGAALVSGMSVTVTAGGKDYYAILSNVPSGTETEAEALLYNDTLDESEPAVVKDGKGNEIGRGALAINRPLRITASTGTIDKLYVEKGDEVKAGGKLARLTGAVLDPSFELKLVERQKLQRELDEAVAELDSLKITAPAGGIVAGLALQDGGAVQKGMAVCTIRQDSAFKLVIAVDELDIPRIAVGQKAKLKIDALPDADVSGTVVKIAAAGVKANDVTTFDVTLEVGAPAGAMAAMSASADIEVAAKSGVLLVPVEAVQSAGGKSWILLAAPQDIRQANGPDGSARGGDNARARTQTRLPGFGFPGTGAAAQAVQRTRVEVKVGLVSDAWAEIQEGLHEGDEVAVPVAQSSLAGMMGFGGMRAPTGRQSGDAVSQHSPRD